MNKKTKGGVNELTSLPKNKSNGAVSLAYPCVLPPAPCCIPEWKIRSWRQHGRSGVGKRGAEMDRHGTVVAVAGQRQRVKVRGRGDVARQSQLERSGRLV